VAGVESSGFRIPVFGRKHSALEIDVVPRSLATAGMGDWGI
jgi:hypothetical protein